MMISYDDIDAESFCMADGSDIASSTVDSDDEFYILFCEFIEKIFLESISIMHSMWESV